MDSTYGRQARFCLRVLYCFRNLGIFTLDTRLSHGGMPQDKNCRCTDDPKDSGEGSGEPEEWDTAYQKNVRTAFVPQEGKILPNNKKTSIKVFLPVASG